MSITWYSASAYAAALEDEFWANDDHHTIGRNGKGPLLYPADQKLAGTCGPVGLAHAVTICYLRETNKLVSASTQHIVDCGFHNLRAAKPDEAGCKPAHVIDLLKFAFMRGIHQRQNYRQYAECKLDCDQNDVTSERFFLVRAGDKKLGSDNELEEEDGFCFLETEDDVIDVLKKNRPVLAAIAATDRLKYQRPFELYSETLPAGRQADHLVTIVGYGTTWYGKDFFTILNSWGPCWANGGYGMVGRNMVSEFVGITKVVLAPPGYKTKTL